jgi:hypothetical protein
MRSGWMRRLNDNSPALRIARMARKIVKESRVDSKVVASALSTSRPLPIWLPIFAASRSGSGLPSCTCSEARRLPPLIFATGADLPRTFGSTSGLPAIRPKLTDFFLHDFRALRHLCRDVFGYRYQVNQDSRRAAIGSSRAARRAGMKLASKATANRTSGTARNTAGSCGRMP